MTGRNSAVFSASPPNPLSKSRRNAPHPTTRQRPCETRRPFAPRTQTFFVSGWHCRDRPKANLRKFRGYSSDCQNQKYEAISRDLDSNQDKRSQSRFPGPIITTSLRRPRSRFPEGAKLRGREGHHSCPGRKANDETQEPDALLTAIAKVPGMGRMSRLLDLFAHKVLQPKVARLRNSGTLVPIDRYIVLDRGIHPIRTLFGSFQALSAVE